MPTRWTWAGSSRQLYPELTPRSPMLFMPHEELQPGAVGGESESWVCLSHHLFAQPLNSQPLSGPHSPPLSPRTQCVLLPPHRSQRGGQCHSTGHLCGWSTLHSLAGGCHHGFGAEVGRWLCPCKTDDKPARKGVLGAGG